MKTALFIIAVVLCAALPAHADRKAAGQAETPADAAVIPEPAPPPPWFDEPRAAPRPRLPAADPPRDRPASKDGRPPIKDHYGVNPCMGGSAPDWCR